MASASALPSGSFPVRLPVLTSFDDKLGCASTSQTNLFFPNLLLVMLFHFSSRNPKTICGIDNPQLRTTQILIFFTLASCEFLFCCPLRKESSLMRTECYTHHGYRNIHRKSSLTLCPSSNSSNPPQTYDPSSHGTRYASPHVGASSCSAKKLLVTPITFVVKLHPWTLFSRLVVIVAHSIHSCIEMLMFSFSL